MEMDEYAKMVLEGIKELVETALSNGIIDLEFVGDLLGKADQLRRWYESKLDEEQKRVKELLGL